MYNPRNKNVRERSRIRLRLAAECRPCWICRVMGRKGTIDYSLRFPHPYSFVVDELVPVSKYWLGGYSTPEEAAYDYKNLAAAHKVCNEWRSNKTVAEVMEIARGRKSAKKPPTHHTTSRDWSNPHKEVD